MISEDRDGLVNKKISPHNIIIRIPMGDQVAVPIFN